MAKIKIVHVITRLIKGGAQKVCLDIVEGLPQGQYEVSLLSGPETGPEGSLWDKARQVPGVTIKAIPELVREISPIKDLTALIKLYFYFCKTRPGIVHCHTSKAGFIACIAGWLARVPVIIYAPYGHLFSTTAMIPSVSHSTLRMRLFYYLTKLVCLLSVKVIAQNSADRDEQVKLRLAPAGKFEVIHNSVEVRPISQTGSGSKRYPLLATVGRLSAEKGQVYLLEALKSVRKEFPDTQLLVIGDGILRKELETFVEKENLNNNVRFTGLCDDPSQLLKDIDIFVLPSLYESFGIVLLEAMAQGKPAVASNVNGIPGVVAHNQTGILVPPANPQALSEAIIKLAHDKELAWKMGQAGYELVKKLFRKEQMVADFDNLYKRTIEKTLNMSLRATAKQSHSANAIATSTSGALAMTQERTLTTAPTVIPSGLIIEPAAKSDLPVMAAMHLEPSATKVREIIRKNSGAYRFYLDKVKMFYAMEPNGVLVVRENNQIAGFAIISKKSGKMKQTAFKKGYILHFAVKALLLQYGTDKKMLKKLFMVPYANFTGRRISSPVALESDNPAKIWVFIVMKESRNQGLGLKLIEAACAYAGRQNNNISATFFKDNIPALNLYKKAGFAIRGECLESTGPSYYLSRRLANTPSNNPTLKRSIKTANRAVYNAKSVEQYEQNPSIFEAGRQETVKNIIARIAKQTSGGTPPHQNNLPDYAVQTDWCGGKFLDIGCGTGNLVKKGSGYFPTAIGMDMAVNLLKHVKKANPEINLVVADADYPPFKNNTFDCVTLYAALHHLFNPVKTMGGVSPLVKPGGYLYTDHDPNYFFGRFYRFYYRLRYRGQPGFDTENEETAEFHNTKTGGINPESLKAKLLNNGFRDVQINYRHTSNPSLPLLARLGLLMLKASARIVPLKSFYTHFYIIGRR
ncbi:MAG: GNAT family N-acetyltransferase [Planctomycetes bacterium]|nr:GNAT family N-acetyltransferase [Planctomycetota bacterium]